MLLASKMFVFEVPATKGEGMGKGMGEMNTRRGRES